MTDYTSPTITEIGSVSDVTRGAGGGPKWDGLFDLIAAVFTDEPIGTQHS